jgi:hypothetical protein
MGIGPWAQGDLIRDVQKTERARFRRAVRRELKLVESGEMRTNSQFEQALHRILESSSPRKARA